ncbi:bacterio-opsin activator domain-containing protein [Halogeometricum limi]|uniref:bacterio-opsin activator domain-containing protein n=1 Tax=Halogeometricum limi TaxID=555875 RepID=UPI00158740C3|nr:bacterio-opsin activator domain-containing protein [Halogeometricum limi]
MELEYRIRDDRVFLVAESGKMNCELVLNEVVPQSGGNLLEFVTVRDAPADSVLADALDRPDVLDARVITEDADAGLLELLVTDPELVGLVGDARAIPRLVRADRGVGHVVVEVPPGGDPQRVVAMFRERHPGSKLVARREHDGAPLFTEYVLRERVLDELTDRQREVFLTAYEMGYFDQPRRVSAVQCADYLGISQSTFSQHFRVALRKILDGLLAV